MRKGSLTSDDLSLNAQFLYDKFITLFNENFSDSFCKAVIDIFDKLLDTVSDDGFNSGYNTAKEEIKDDLLSYIDECDEVSISDIEEYIKGL